MSSNPFTTLQLEEDIPEIGLDAEKKYLLKAKRVVYIIGVIIGLTLIIFTGSSYLLGKSQGEYNERYKLAEKYNLVHNVDQTKHFEGSTLTLSRILLDSSLTSLTLESDLKLDYFESVTLRDNLNNFYRRAFVPFERTLSNSTKNITILDYDPVLPQADTLILELTKYYQDETSDSVVFEIPLHNIRQNAQPQKYAHILEDRWSGVKASLDLERGISHTELELNLDYNETNYDGVNFGWFNQDSLKDITTLELKSASVENPLKLLSIQDITIEKMPSADTPLPKQTNRTYQLITTPLPENSSELELHFDNLFAFNYIYNLGLPLNFKNQASSFNKVFSASGYTIEMSKIKKENDVVQLFYDIKDAKGQTLPEHLLDARVRKADDLYEVPVQGKPMKEGTKRYLEFTDMNSDQYILDIFRVGFELQSGTHILHLDELK